jgi:Family of unknown function (DUF5317)
MVVVVVVAVVVGYLAGGRLGRLADLRFRGSQLLLLAVAFALTGFGRGGNAGIVATGAAGLLLLAFLSANVAAQRGGVRAAFALMAGGWLLNLTVIIANGAMPTPARVLDGPEWWPNVWLAPHLVGHVPIGSTTRLVWLADSIQLRLPHVLVPLSVGDLLLFAGVVALVVTAMRRVPAEGRRSRPRSPASSSRS